LAFFGKFHFLCRFCTFEDDLGRFLGTGRFLDIVSGHRMINFHWKLCTRICNFLFCLFHAFRFAVSGYSSAKPKVSRSLLMEWASFFLCKKYVYIAFQKRVWLFQRCRCEFILLLAFFGAIWLFLRVDLAFFAYDYLATLVPMGTMLVTPDLGLVCH